MNYTVIGCVPALSAPPPLDQQQICASVFRDMLRRVVGPEPYGARLIIQQYVSRSGCRVSVVVCRYNPHYEVPSMYAASCWVKRVSHWDVDAELALRKRLNRKRSA